MDNYFNNSEIADNYKQVSFKRKEYLESIDKILINELNNLTLLDIGSGDGLKINRIAQLSNIKYLAIVEPSLPFLICAEISKQMHIIILQEIIFMSFKKNLKLLPYYGMF